MRERDSWSQDVVLEALCKSVAQGCGDNVAPDFILLTGDVAFSGHAPEYRLAEQFIESLCVAARLAKERVFCVPGNHDIDRECPKLSFEGARATLKDQNQTDKILGSKKEMETLLARQQNFREFQSSCFGMQSREASEEGLAYVSRLVVDDVRVAIIGLDSAWLSEGGRDDHGKLLLGERQVINAIRQAQEHDERPHLTLAMAHHPFHLLQKFDQRPVQSRIERACHFFHCGHLHEHEILSSGSSPRDCLAVSAGAAFETRQSRNSYSSVTVDLLKATRTLGSFHYAPANGLFSLSSKKKYPIEIPPTEICELNELAGELGRYDTSLDRWKNYLAALLLGQKSEVLVPGQNCYAFGAFPVIHAQTPSELKARTEDFMVFRNVLRVLYGCVTVQDLLRQHGEPILRYAEALDNICSDAPEIADQLSEREHDARKLDGQEATGSYGHTTALMKEYAEGRQWDLLRSHAERLVRFPDPLVSVPAKQMLALSLANSRQEPDRRKAITLLDSLEQEGKANLRDSCNFVSLLLDCQRPDEAKDALLRAAKRHPGEGSGAISELGHRIIEATGDRSFRVRLEAVTTGRNDNG